MTVGEDEAYLGLLIVVNIEHWIEALRKHNHSYIKVSKPSCNAIKTSAMLYVTQQLQAFPDNIRINGIALVRDHWSTVNGILTHTSKTKRTKVVEKHVGDHEVMDDGFRSAQIFRDNLTSAVPNLSTTQLYKHFPSLEYICLLQQSQHSLKDFTD